MDSPREPKRFKPTFEAVVDLEDSDDDEVEVVGVTKPEVEVVKVVRPPPTPPSTPPTSPRVSTLSRFQQMVARHDQSSFDEAILVVADIGFLGWRDILALVGVNKSCNKVFAGKRQNEALEPLVSQLESMYESKCNECHEVLLPLSKQKCQCGDNQYHLLQRDAFAHLDPRAEIDYDKWSNSKKSKAMVKFLADMLARLVILEVQPTLKSHSASTCPSVLHWP